MLLSRALDVCYYLLHLALCSSISPLTLADIIRKMKLLVGILGSWSVTCSILSLWFKWEFKPELKTGIVSGACGAVEFHEQHGGLLSLAVLFWYHAGEFAPGD